MQHQAVFKEYCIGSLIAQQGERGTKNIKKSDKKYQDDAASVVLSINCLYLVQFKVAKIIRIDVLILEHKKLSTCFVTPFLRISSWFCAFDYAMSRTLFCFFIFLANAVVCKKSVTIPRKLYCVENFL